MHINTKKKSDKWKAAYGPGSLAYVNCWGGGCLDGSTVPEGWKKYKDTGKNSNVYIFE